MNDHWVMILGQPNVFVPTGLAASEDTLLLHPAGIEHPQFDSNWPAAETMSLLWRQLNQHGRRKSYNWKGFKELIERFQIERPWAE